MAGLFIKLDTNFWSHPKVLAAGEPAAVLYQQMAMYCMDHTTDGHVPDAQLPRFGLPRLRQRLTALADVGMIERVGGGWLVPGYVERYKTAAQVDELSRTRSESGKKGGRPRKQGAKANGNQVAFTAHNPEVEVDVEGEVETSSSSDTSAARPPGPGDEADDLPTELLRSAGYPSADPTHGERATVATLQRRGWTPDHLRGMALRASHADIDARAYLAKLLAEALNSDPPPQQRPARSDPRWDRSAETTAAIAAATYVPYEPPAEVTT